MTRTHVVPASRPPLTPGRAGCTASLEGIEAHGGACGRQRCDAPTDESVARAIGQPWAFPRLKASSTGPKLIGARAVSLLVADGLPFLEGSPLGGLPIVELDPDKRSA